MNSIKYEMDLLAKLVEIDTNCVSRKGYKECASIIVEEAEKNSLHTEIVNGEEGAKDGISRPNVIVTLDTNSDITLLLESHFDTVPPGSNWSVPPFKLHVEDGKAYGRGTADNKSGIAAAIGAMKQLKKEKIDINLKLIAGVDEEVGGRFGADYVLNDFGVKGDAALILDAGPERIYLGASGIIWGKIIIEGIQGHAGYPHKAINAVEKSYLLLSELGKYKKLVEKKKSILCAPPESPRQFVWGRFSVTMIHGGEKENIIPGICEIRFDRRLLPEEDIKEAEKELNNYFEEALKKIECKGSLEIINRLSGYYTPKNLTFVETISESIEKITGKKLLFAAELGGNDGSFFVKKKIPIVCYGTIRLNTQFHGVDEFVYIEDIKNVRDLIVHIGEISRKKIVG